MMRPIQTHHVQISFSKYKPSARVGVGFQAFKQQYQVFDRSLCLFDHYFVRHLQSTPLLYKIEENHKGQRTIASFSSPTINIPDTVPEVVEYISKISGRAAIIEALTTAAIKFSSSNKHAEVVSLHERITKTIPLSAKDTAGFKKIIAKSMCKLKLYQQAITLLKSTVTSATCFDILISCKDEKFILPEHVSEVLGHMKEANMPISHQFLNNIISSYLNWTQTENLIEIAQVMAAYNLFEPNGTRQMVILADAYLAIETSKEPENVINFVSSVIKSCFKHRMAPVAFQFFAKYTEQLPQDCIHLVFEHLNDQKVNDFVPKLGLSQKIIVYKILLQKATTSSDTESMKKYYTLLKESLLSAAKDVQIQLAQDVKNNDLESGIRHFNQLGGFELPDVPTQVDISCMINLCAKYKKPELLNHFVNQSLDSNQLASLQIEVCMAAGKLDMVVELMLTMDKVKGTIHKGQLVEMCKAAINERHAKLFLACLKRLSPTDLSFDVESINRILSTACQTDMSLSVNIFSEMLLWKVKPNVATFNYLLEGYARQSDLKNMLDCFKIMVTNGFSPNGTTISVVQLQLEKARANLNHKQDTNHE